MHTTFLTRGDDCTSSRAKLLAEINKHLTYMENHNANTRMPFDPDFTPEAKNHQVQISLTKEQIFAIGIGVGIVAAMIFVAILS
jgi:hypothetical protein